MIPPQLGPDNPGIPRDSGPEIVRQTKLLFNISVGPDQFFHDLKENTGRVFGQGPAGGMEHLVPQ